MMADRDGVLWQALDISHSWDGKKRGKRGNGSYRHVSRSIRAATCQAADITKVTKAFAKASLDHFNHGPQDYRGYLGEYPSRWPYVHRSPEPITFDGENGGIAFQYLALWQLRGREWGRDYSQVGESKTLLMPAPALVEAGDLRWDRRGSWRDATGQVQVQDPRWWSDGPASLVCRVDLIDRFLEQNDLALVILGFQEKFIAGTMERSGHVAERTLFIRRQGQTKLIKRKVESD